MALFDQGRQALAAAAAAASETVMLIHGQAATELPARIGSKIFRTYAGNAPVTVMARRFIVNVADLPAMPVNGDAILWNGRKYRLGCPDGGPPWRWHGADNACVAIYATDQGGTPAAPPRETAG